MKEEPILNKIINWFRNYFREGLEPLENEKQKEKTNKEPN